MAIRVVRPYLEILATPGARRFSAAAWFGRVSRSTAAIGAILLVAASTENYALAGAVSGAVVLGAATAGPAWARWADRLGQTLVLPFAILAAALSAVALILAVQLGTPPAVWFFAAFLVGASSIDAGSLARARWMHLLPTQTGRHTALALESVGDELTFVIGPPVVTLLAGLVSPAFGFGVGVAVSIVGLSVLFAQRSTAPRPSPTTRAASWLPAGVLGLLPSYVGVGLVFGSVDLAAVGIAGEVGTPAVAGLLLAIFAVGSVSAGFVFGAVSATWPPLRRLAISSAAYTVALASFLLVHDVVGFAVASLVAGFATTPVLISGASLIETIVNRSAITTAMAWPSVAMSLGVTVGASLAGAAINTGGGLAAVIVTASAGLVVGASGLINAALRSRRRSRLLAPEGA